MGRQNKYVCIHGHFYQPPRENAWLDQIEIQESAYPFHDWNERINFECYAPNTSARILDHNGLIHKIINNYTYLSYNFGPTLLSWMEREDKETYKAMIGEAQIMVLILGVHIWSICLLESLWHCFSMMEVLLKAWHLMVF